MDIQQTLLSLMAIPSSFNLEAIVKTADGFYIGRDRGDIGYNRFIGKPSTPHSGPGKDLILKRWHALSAGEQRLIVHAAKHPLDGSPIDLQREFGVPTHNESNS
jgi:hypothetical protein